MKRAIMNSNFRNLNQYFNKTLDYGISATWNDDIVPWECYRCVNTNIVYFIHNKCASSLYDELMLKLKWEPTTTRDIDWDTDIVISHIRNPLIKHRKGIVEGLFTCHPEMIRHLTTPEGLDFLSNVTSFDPHSYTIRQMLGKNATKVRWIPIDIDLDHKKFTFDLFEAHGAIISAEIKDWFFKLPKVNTSYQNELEIYEMLANITPPSVILRLIDFDVCLYNALLVPAEPDNFQNRVAQLVELGSTEESAINQADAEVFSGEYHTWKFD